VLRWPQMNHWRRGACRPMQRCAPQRASRQLRVRCHSDRMQIAPRNLQATKKLTTSYATCRCAMSMLHHMPVIARAVCSLRRVR